MKEHWLQIVCLIILAVPTLLFASTLVIHFRGKKRHKFHRQLTDHSTFMAPYNALIYLFSAVKNKPYLDLNEFPELNVLQENWQTIRDEAARLYADGDIDASEKYKDIGFNSFFKRGWRRFNLKWYDEVLPSASQTCPKTIELIKSIPSIHAALFALLPPRSKLGEHRDPFAGSLRYHLGLMTPNSDQCRIYVDGDPYAWRDGQAVLFDETYIHSVANDTDDYRLILFCDVARPMNNPISRFLNEFIANHIIKITASPNRDTEKTGIVNKFAGYYFAIRNYADSLKKKNRKLYKQVNAALNYALVACALAAVGAVIFFAVHHH